MHVKENLLDEDGKIDQKKIDLVARMGGNWYTRARAGMFEVPKPITTLGMGIDAIPEAIRKSTVLTGNDLGKLGNVEKLPSEKEIATFIQNDPAIFTILKTKERRKIHSRAKEYLEKNDPGNAWKLLLAKI
ncbi:MAG TPA: flavin reductase family protein, partial [Salinimicrobium sp.]|nr:flavin reductase family protein [Salinimicrobium sp.]